jgi:hypothetical protein
MRVLAIPFFNRSRTKLKTESIPKEANTATQGITGARILMLLQ